MQEDWDIPRLRAETAGCEQTAFFNNAGASLQPRPVVARVIEHLRLEEQIGGYEASDRVAGELEGLYGSVARLLGCAPEEIALQENATRAWEMAFYSLRFAPGDRIVTAATEYASNYIAFLQVARKTGAEICVVESDQAGEVDLQALRGLLDDRVKLIAYWALDWIAARSAPNVRSEAALEAKSDTDPPHLAARLQARR